MAILTKKDIQYILKYGGGIERDYKGFEALKQKEFLRYSIEFKTWELNKKGIEALKKLDITTRITLHMKLNCFSIKDLFVEKEYDQIKNLKKTFNINFCPSCG